MAVVIRNLLVTGPVLVPLTTGTTLRLSPGAASGELPEAEATENAKVTKLVGLGLLELVTAEVGEETGAAAGNEGEQAPAEGVAAGSGAGAAAGSGAGAEAGSGAGAEAGSGAGAAAGSEVAAPARTRARSRKQPGATG